MKAAFLTGVRSIEVREVEAPRVDRDDDVLVRSKAVGVCGSDLHYYLSDSVGGDTVKYPFIPGHECAGIVEAVGKAVTRVKPGDAVVVEPAVSCGACDQCRMGRSHTCRKLLFLGHYGELTGGMAEFALAPERNCVPLPPKMTVVQGILAEPLSIALYAASLAGSVRGKTAAVLGTGPIGLCAVMALKADGAAAVYATEKVEARLAAAATAGADWTGNTDREDIVAEIRSRESLGLDLVFEVLRRAVRPRPGRRTRSNPAGRSSSSASPSSRGCRSQAASSGAARSASRASAGRTSAWRRLSR